MEWGPCSWMVPPYSPHPAPWFPDLLPHRPAQVGCQRPTLPCLKPNLPIFFHIFLSKIYALPRGVWTTPSAFVHASPWLTFQKDPAPNPTSPSGPLTFLRSSLGPESQRQLLYLSRGIALRQGGRAPKAALAVDSGTDARSANTAAGSLALTAASPAPN